METSKQSLPPEAYKELQSGQKYTPFVPAERGRFPKGHPSNSCEP